MKTILTCFVVLILFYSCGNKRNTADEGHVHENDIPGIVYTVYNAGFEFFIELQPLIKGQTSEILAHVTKLDRFKPATKGQMTASLITSGKGIRQKRTNPERPGIYHFQLQPQIHGKGHFVFDLQTEEGNISVKIPGVEVFEDEHDAIHSAEKAAINVPGSITFTKEMAWKVDFSTGYPDVGTFGTVIRSTARIIPAQNDEILVSAKMSGTVYFTGKNITEGKEVEKDNSLFSISGKELHEDNTAIRFQEAKNNFEKAESDYLRASSLVKEQIISEKEFLETENRYKNTGLIYENLKNNFARGVQSVASPDAGFIHRIYVSNGQHVEAGEPLFSVVKRGDLFLKSEVQQRYAADLLSLQTATIRIPSGKSVISLEELGGKIISVGKSASNHYLIPVTLAVPSTDVLIPGGIVEIFLKTRSDNDKITVPNTALIEEQGNYSVFVQLTPELFEKREVKTGSSDGIRTVITGGLSSDERIVTKGGIFVKLSSVATSLDPHAGHVH